MKQTQYTCRQSDRRTAVRTTFKDGKPILNGIDFLEVSGDQLTLEVHFIHPLPGTGSDAVPGGPALVAGNLRITGGERVTGIHPQGSITASGRVLSVPVSTPGDFSTYTLAIITSQNDLRPPSGFDPLLSQVDFSFKVDCSNDFDCLEEDDCLPDIELEPEINYLAKDYASFRQLMLDRMAALSPQWKDRNPADLGVMLVEMLAYTADYLSYQQDAIATEAYLYTARRRVSVRRHARLVDYDMHDGCNARTWVQLIAEQDEEAIDPDQPLLKKGAQLLTHIPELPRRIVPGSEAHTKALESGAIIFELMHPVLRLYKKHNQLDFYTWGESDCCLPQGATRATLCDSLVKLQPGDVLIFEERLGPQTGEPEDADPAHRCAVRLLEVQSDDGSGSPLTDPLTGVAITEIRWHPEDALPFPLCLSTGSEITGVSVVLGNIFLADHGATLQKPEDLGLVPAPHMQQVPTAPADVLPACRPAESDAASKLQSIPGRFRPTLEKRPLTYAAPDPFQDEEQNFRSTRSAFGCDLHNCTPQFVNVTGTRESTTRIWTPQRDLLAAGGEEPYFVVEVESDGEASLRFGDGCQGARPPEGTQFSAIYRVGNGLAGNIGREALYHVVTDVQSISGGINPMPARGGMEMETIEHARLHAPYAFRKQERAVTPEDYSNLAQGYQDVQRTAATLRWTGSWHTVFLTVDRHNGLPVDVDFEEDLRTYLERYRMAQHDLEVDGPRYVSLEIDMTVCVDPGYFSSHVRSALLQVFSNRRLPGGKLGIFHPDQFSFGQTVYLSPLYQAAEANAGVQSVVFTKFQRQDQSASSGLDQGYLTLGRLEIPRLDNDPNFPKRGVFRLTTLGGK